MAVEDNRFFSVDKGEKRRASWRAVPATIGGKVALAVAALFLVAGIALVFVGMSVSSGSGEFASADEETMMVLVFSFALVCIVFCPLTVACAYRQRNIGCAMRREERMQLVGGRTIVYEYIEQRGRADMVWVVREGIPLLTRFPQRIVVADLDAVRVRRVGMLGEWKLTGLIRMRLEEDGGEETALDEFVIGSYFGRDLNELLSSYAARR